MNELERICPSRRSLQFDEVNQDHPNEFYEFHFSNLLTEIYALVSGTFCPGNHDSRSRYSPWLQQHPRQFIAYVELVARPDLSAGRWERLLRDENERKYLLQATIMKVLDAQVFSSLLFGADSEHRKILESTDASLVNAEGFRRSNLRAQANSVYLEAKRGQPPDFWEHVDRLCAQVLALLMPMYAWTSESEGWHPPSIPDLYQLLHNIVAYAGWLNVCIRLSPSIIVFDWTTPGEEYHVDQVNLSQDLYEFSKESVQRRDRRSKNPLPSGNRKRIARVKISVAPRIVRYKPAVDTCGTKGTETYTIMKPHVVYYHGWRLDRDNDKTYLSLPGYIRRLRDRKTVPHGTALLIMLFAVIYLWVKFQASGQDAWQRIRQGLSPTSELEL